MVAPFINHNGGGLFRKKGMMRFILVLALVMLVFQVACGPNTAPAEKKDNQEKGEIFELKLAHFFPGTHPAETELVSNWAKAIEEATGGRVVITSYPGETLLKAPDIYEGVVGGVADLGLSCFAYTRGRFPVLEAFELPGITYKNSKVASKVAWEGIKMLQPDEVQDTRLMMVFATGPGDLFTKVPIRKLEDLQGLEIRATGLSAQTLQALGAIPVAMAQSEAYEALSKGIVQGNLSPVEVLQGWRHAEVTDYLTLTPFLYNTLFFITMNLDRWNSLPPDLQATIEEVNEKYHEEVAMGLWDSQNEKALKWALEEMGMEVIELSQEEIARWVSLIEPIQDNFKTKMNEKGLDGDKILETVKSLAEKYNHEY